MADLQVLEIKTLEGLVKTLIQTSKSIDGNTERLRSVENLLERVVASQERNEEMMAKAWESYNSIAHKNK